MHSNVKKMTSFIGVLFLLNCAGVDGADTPKAPLAHSLPPLSEPNSPEALPDVQETNAPILMGEDDRTDRLSTGSGESEIESEASAIPMGEGMAEGSLAHSGSRDSDDRRDSASPHQPADGSNGQDNQLDRMTDVDDSESEEDPLGDEELGPDEAEATDDTSHEPLDEFSRLPAGDEQIGSGEGDMPAVAAEDDVEQSEDDIPELLELPCPATVQGNRQYLYCRDELTWVEARDFCREYDFELVTIRNQRENNYLLENAQTFGLDEIWIGLNDRARGGDFRWASQERTNFQAWNRNQPNNRNDQDCVEVHGRDGWAGRWNDEECDDTQNFVCESTLQ